ALANPLHQVAIDHDGSGGLLDDVGPDPEHDRGVGERDHGLTATKRRQGVFAVVAVQPAGDQVAAGAEDEAMLRRRDAQPAIPAWPADPDPPGQALARRVGDEVDLRLVRRVRGPRLAQDESKSRPDRADHGRRMPARTTIRPCAEGTGQAMTRARASTATRRQERRPVRAGERGVGWIRVMADPTGFEPAISSVTGWHVGPLHHGSERRTRRIPERLRAILPPRCPSSTSGPTRSPNPRPRCAARWPRRRLATTCSGTTPPSSRSSNAPRSSWARRPACSSPPARWATSSPWSRTSGGARS